MAPERTVAETEVADGATPVPEPVRAALGVAEGDAIRWIVTPDGELRVEPADCDGRTFADFAGYDGDGDVDAERDHDEWGLEESD